MKEDYRLRKDIQDFFKVEGYLRPDVFLCYLVFQFTGKEVPPRKEKRFSYLVLFWKQYIQRARLLDTSSEIVQNELFSIEAARKANFYLTQEWRAVRYAVLKKSKGKCELCGAEDKLQVDHIKPRSTHPELALSLNNLQVLCEDCNLGKGAKDQTDWRK